MNNTIDVKKLEDLLGEILTRRYGTQIRVTVVKIPARG